MQMASNQLNLLVKVRGGTAARPTNTFVFSKVVYGTMKLLSFSNFQSQYKDGEGWVEGGTYYFYSREVLNLGDTLEYEGVRYSVKSVMKARVRNQYHLIRTANAV